MGGTTWSTPISSSLLEAKGDEDDKEDEVDGEDGDTGGSVLTLWTGRAAGSFFFLVGERTVELENIWLAVETCLNVPYDVFLQLF